MGDSLKEPPGILRLLFRSFLIAISVAAILLFIVQLPELDHKFSHYRANHSKKGTRNACINNLRQIDGAKQQWQLENHKTDSDTPTSAEVASYLKNNQFPVCPYGGKYTIGPVNEDPACSVPGHVLPSP